jgi:hypothetical protein
VTFLVLEGEQKRTEIVCPAKNAEDGAGSAQRTVPVSGGEYRIRLLFAGIIC